VGGGAASLIIYFAEKMGLKYSIPENAEVISSIGVALSMVRDVVERIIPSPTKEAISAIKMEAMNKAIQSGATPESVEIHIDIDPQTSKVTAIATGSTEVKTTDLLKECSEEELREIAAGDMRISAKQTELLEKSRYIYIFGEKTESENKSGAVRIVDTKGFIKVQRGNAMVKKTIAGKYLDAVKELWEAMAVYQTELIARPDYYLCIGARVMDFTASDFEQLKLLMDIEAAALESDTEVMVVAANIKQS